MTKSELVRSLGALHPHLRRNDIERVVETIFASIGHALSRRDRIEIRGFGVFFVKHRKARTGRNPRTGTTVEVSTKVIPYFKIGKHLHTKLNEEN